MVSMLTLMTNEKLEDIWSLFILLVFMCLETFVSYKSCITKLMDWGQKGNLKECEIESGYILNTGGRCLRNIYGTKCSFFLLRSRYSKVTGRVDVVI